MLKNISGNWNFGGLARSKVVWHRDWYSEVMTSFMLFVFEVNKKFDICPASEMLMQRN